MDNFDPSTLVNWLTQGLISLIFGLVGGYMGSWIQYHFSRKLERDREQREFRSRLTEGVSEFVEKEQHATLNGMSEGFGRFFRRVIAPIVMLVGAVFAFAYSPWMGLGGLFLLGMVVGWRSTSS